VLKHDKTLKRRTNFIKKTNSKISPVFLAIIIIVHTNIITYTVFTKFSSQSRLKQSKFTYIEKIKNKNSSHLYQSVFQ